MIPQRRILVVEDEGALRDLLRRYLERCGYEVEALASGDDAWDHFESGPDRFDAFLIDLTLPGMSGDELARRIAERKTGARVVVASGYRYNPAPLLELSARVRFLHKPFAPKDLVAELELLFGPPG